MSTLKMFRSRTVAVVVGLAFSSSAVGCGDLGSAREASVEPRGEVEEVRANESHEEQMSRVEPIAMAAMEKYLDGREHEWTAEEWTLLSMGVEQMLANADVLAPQDVELASALREALEQNVPHPASSVEGQTVQAVLPAVVVAAIVAGVIATIAGALAWGTRCYFGARDCGYEVIRMTERCSQDGYSQACCTRSAQRAASQCTWSCGSTRPAYGNFQRCI